MHETAMKHCIVAITTVLVCIVASHRSRAQPRKLTASQQEVLRPGLEQIDHSLRACLQRHLNEAGSNPAGMPDRVQVTLKIPGRGGVPMGVRVRESWKKHLSRRVKVCVAQQRENWVFPSLNIDHPLTFKHIFALNLPKASPITLAQRVHFHSAIQVVSRSVSNCEQKHRISTAYRTPTRQFELLLIVPGQGGSPIKIKTLPLNGLKLAATFQRCLQDARAEWTFPSLSLDRNIILRQIHQTKIEPTDP